MDKKDEAVKQILKEAFDIAKINCFKKNKTAWSRYIVNSIEENYGDLLNERTLIRAYDNYLDRDDKDINNKKGSDDSTIEILCKFLGYENYQAYIKVNHAKILKKVENENISNLDNITHQENGKEKIEIKTKPKLKKAYLFLSLLLIGLLFSVWWFNKKEFNPIENEEPKPQDTLVITEEEIKPIIEDKILENKITIDNKVEIAIFNETELDIEITQILQKTLFKNRTSSVYQIFDLNTQKIKSLQAGNFASTLNSKSNKASQYCFGKVSYKYQTSKANSMLQVCFLNVTFSTYSLQGNLLSNLSNTKRITANGFTKDEAKYNALKKLEQL